MKFITFLAILLLTSNTLCYLRKEKATVESKTNTNTEKQELKKTPVNTIKELGSPYGPTSYATENEQTFGDFDTTVVDDKGNEIKKPVVVDESPLSNFNSKKDFGLNTPNRKEEKVKKSDKKKEEKKEEKKSEKKSDKKEEKKEKATRKETKQAYNTLFNKDNLRPEDPSIVWNANRPVPKTDDPVVKQEKNKDIKEAADGAENYSASNPLTRKNKKDNTDTTGKVTSTDQTGTQVPEGKKEGTEADRKQSIEVPEKSGKKVEATETDRSKNQTLTKEEKPYHTNEASITGVTGGDSFPKRDPTDKGWVAAPQHAPLHSDSHMYFNNRDDDTRDNNYGNDVETAKENFNHSIPLRKNNLKKEKSEKSDKKQEEKTDKSEKTEELKVTPLDNPHPYDDGVIDKANNSFMDNRADFNKTAHAESFSTDANNYTKDIPKPDLNKPTYIYKGSSKYVYSVAGDKTLDAHLLNERYTGPNNDRTPVGSMTFELSSTHDKSRDEIGGRDTMNGPPTPKVPDVVITGPTTKTPSNNQNEEYATKYMDN